MSKPKVIVICGPTASGKTALSIELAKKIKEIIDTKSSFADWLNTQRVRDQLKQEIKIYP